MNAHHKALNLIMKKRSQKIIFSLLKTKHTYKSNETAIM
jgi:hypothetical protein